MEDAVANIEDLKKQIASAESEIQRLHQRIREVPERTINAERDLMEIKGQLSQAVSQNEKLTRTLTQA
ncbi:MAG: proteasome ATPase, partial [Actinobacteria bacterium]|nr:proteasome ATPase [Actinomycetota bacterium]